MFAGEKINVTENRAVLHVALRAPEGEHIVVDGVDVVPEVHAVLSKMADFSDRVRSGAWTGHTGRRIRNVVNVGIGGSDLGPAMAYEALRDFSQRDMTFRYVSNVDGTDFWESVRDLEPEETLFVICSKTFTTLETLTNAHTARDWLLAGLGEPADSPAVAKHFVAVSTNAEKVREFGIDTENMFGFWDWVGGRYSYDSAIGLSLMISIGAEQFREMLAGFHAMDTHFRTAPFDRNLPVLLGLIGIWYDDFFGAETQAILPYSQYLARFPAYLQQLDMESDGKSVDLEGNPVDVPDRSDRLGPARHERPARVLPADPPGHEADPVRLHRLRPRQPRGRRPPEPADGQLLRPDRGARVRQDGRGGRGRRRRPRSRCPTAPSPATTRPTRSSPRRLTPHVLGQLVAMYEHKVFTQGTIWNINSFDQWGVELGKVLANRIVPELDAKSDPALDHDSSHQRPDHQVPATPLVAGRVRGRGAARNSKRRDDPSIGQFGAGASDGPSAVATALRSPRCAVGLALRRIANLCRVGHDERSAERAMNLCGSRSTTLRWGASVEWF